MSVDYCYSLNLPQDRFVMMKHTFYIFFNQFFVNFNLALLFIYSGRTVQNINIQMNSADIFFCCPHITQKAILLLTVGVNIASSYEHQEVSDP